MGSFFFGNDVDMPTAPTYGESYAEGVQALLDSMGNLYKSDSVYTPLYNALMRQAQSENLAGYNKDLQDLTLDAYGDYAPRLAEAQLRYEKEYGPQFIERQLANQRAADPTYWAIRDAYGAQVQDDLANGNNLSEAQRRQVDQSTRAAIASRGGSSAGYAPAAQEVLGEFLAGEGLKTQRQNAAAGFLNMGANGYSSNSYGGAAPSAQVSENSYSTVNPYMYSNAASAGNNAANYNNSIYNQQVQWAQNQNNQPSGFATLFGTIANAAGSAALTKQAFSK